MFKSIALVSMLALSNAAFACGGKACDHCDKAPTAAVEDISKAPGTHVALTVGGMKCGACSTKVTDAIKAIDGVNAVSVDHATGKAQVAFDAKKTDPKAFIKAIEALSFEAAVADDTKKG